MAKSTFLLLDGNALLHRAWHAIPPLTTKDGRVVNAVYGFANVIEKLRSQYKPDYIAVAWDLPGGTFRHVEYKEYKAQRVKKEDELYAQIPWIQELLTAYGVPSISAPGFEADDVIGTIATLNAKTPGLETLIITGDMDSLQLVNDATKVVAYVKGLSEVKVYDEAAVKARYGLVPAQLIDYKTLLGDASDNLKGLPGVGQKTALDLLTTYKTVEGIVAAIERGEVPEKFAKKFKDSKETLRLMKRLVTVVCDVPLPDFSLEVAKLKDPDVKALIPMLRDFEFKKLLEKYEKESAAPVKSSPLKHILPTVKMTDAKTVKLPSDVNGPVLGIALRLKAQDLFGASIGEIAITDGKNVFVATQPDDATLAAIIVELTHATEVIGHDLKAMMHGVNRADFVAAVTSSRLYDTMIMAYLVNSGARGYDFSEVTNEVLRLQLPAELSAEEEVRRLFSLKGALVARLKHEEMETLYAEMEAPLIPVLFEMEKAGILVDRPHLVNLSAHFEKSIAEVTKKIYALAGREFNIASPAQMADVLFIDLGLPTKGIKKTQTSYSTAASELDKLEDEHDIIPLIREFREMSKLKSTYSDTLPNQIGADGRIHTTYKQTVAATGRLSSVDPNLQNIPIRSELGREIRSAFIAPPGSVLLSADYSQIELRLAAAMAKDDAFIQAFKDGADIHTRTAAQLLNKPESEVTKNERAAAKAINFSILYGVGARSLARAADLSFDEAKKFIARYFEVHPAIKSYMDAMKEQAHKVGYVETMYGRRRYLPDAQSNLPQLIAGAERMAINMPIQGTNADIIKKAMLKIRDYLRDGGYKTKMLLQVHDELLFEVPENEIERMKTDLPPLMTEGVSLAVPLLVDVETATRWGEME